MTNWNGFKELVLIKKEDVCDTIKSFYFKSKNGEKLNKYIAGQFLPLKIKTDNAEIKDVIRCYSLSDLPNDEMYRLSIKKIDNGLMSSYLHDKLQVGDIIEAMPPAGDFILDESLPKETPIILLSGGIGITPLLSMLLANAKNREIHMVQAVQNSDLHPFNEDIANICKENNLKNTVFFSNPLDKDTLGENYDVKGFVTKEWIKQNLPLNGSFYFCGPPIFMESLEKNLLELGVDKSKINYERFS
ncbi:FAD-binding oxidoreductase [[Clostridium] colinum]|uniref:FAD-binding oxidoreductase n=1 Tax=[Clostridium] colinum TaxID=36835 RepID=UPI002023EC00|nr:FAD-binding oxidoreductase [[Clostridium] colinum]